MFHFSTDRLAGLDAPILMITAPSKVPTLIPNHSLYHDMHIPARKLKKQKPPRETRPPLVDKTASNNLMPRPLHPTSSMLLRTLSTAGEVKLLSCKDDSSPRVCSPDIPSFRPLPPVPSASTLQLPSFLNFSSRSFGSSDDIPPRRSATSLPASVLFCLSTSPVASTRPVVVRKTKNNKVFEGPQWIPAFHHPNSPYVAWPSPVRRRILPPLSPVSPSPVCPSSPRIRPGAVAPEPWASSTFSQTHKNSGKERLSNSWKKLKKSIKRGVKTVVSCLGKSQKSLGTVCTGRDMLRNFHDGDCPVTQPNSSSNAMRSIHVKAHDRGSEDSLASFTSSGSATLVAWLAERRATASCTIDNTPKEMSMEEYELLGSWLDLRQCNGGWVCGVQDCDMHTVGGSPYAASEYPIGLRTAMPLDCAELLSVTHSTPSAPRPSPPGSFSTLPRFHSLPRLPCQYFDICSVQEAKSATLENTARCLTRYHELNIPGRWTFKQPITMDQ